MSEPRAEGEPTGRLDPGTAALLDAVPDPMVVCDAAGRIVVVNAPALSALGYERDDLIGTTIEKLLPIDVHGLLQRHRGHPASSTRLPALSSSELDAVRGDGSTVTIEASLVPVPNGDDVLVVALLRDPETRSREERLFRGLLEAAPDAMVILDDLGHILLVNAQVERMFGYERGRLIGQNVHKLVPGHPELREQIRSGQVARPMVRPMGIAGDVFARRRDGTEFAVEISMSPLETREGPLVLAAFRDVTARMALENANARAKDEFFATVSHELRTPLTSLIGYGELMGDLQQLSPQGTQFLSVMMRSAEREMRLVDDLLTLVQIEGSGLAVRPRTVELADVLRDAVEAARPLAEDGGLALELVLPTEPAPTAGDGDRLGQAVDNLLSNAIKFTPSGGRVQAALRLTADTALVEVVDSGDGISEEEHELVFERLFRGSQAVERHVQGAGLGLPIALAIAKAHGGTIGIIDSTPAGTTFRLTLPLES